MSRPLLLLLPVLLSPAALAAPCASAGPWPTETWPERPVDRQAKAEALEALESFAFTLTGADPERLGLRTNALLLIHDGAVVYERYARGFDASKRHISWSVAKSISSALTGRAVQLGALTLEDSICDHLVDAPDSACQLKVRHLLTFGSGLQWQETYETLGYQGSSVISMLFGVGHRDQVGFVLGHQQVAPPGTRFSYSTGDAHVLSTVARDALAKAHGEDALWTQLFDKVGMGGVVVEQDVKGSTLGGAFMYATPRDFARFGYLFLQDGCWAGEQLLPEGWVTASTTPSDVFLASGDTRTPAGFMWWLNRAVPERGLEKPWEGAPDDTFTANGHWGQYIIVVPSERLVIVRTGDDRRGAMSINELTKRALEVVR